MVAVRVLVLATLARAFVGRRGVHRMAMGALQAEADDDVAAMRARMEALFSGSFGEDEGEDPEVAALRSRGASAKRKPEPETPGSVEEVPSDGTDSSPSGSSLPAGSDVPRGLGDALSAQDAAARPAVPEGLALNLEEAAAHASDSMVAAVMEGKRRILVDARVEGLDPAQPSFDGASLLTWAKDAARRLPYDALVVLDATRGTATAAVDGVRAEPLLMTFGVAVDDEATPDNTCYVVFAPRSFEDMVATRRVFKAAATKRLPVVVLNHRHDEPDAAPPPLEYDDATEAYCLRPLVVRGDTPVGGPVPVRVVVARRYPDPFAVFVDPGKGAYAKVAVFPDKPTQQELTNAIRAAVERR